MQSVLMCVCPLTILHALLWLDWRCRWFTGPPCGLKKNTLRSEVETSTVMERATHLLQLMMMSSGLMRLFSIPIFGWSPRPRKSPGGSIRKFPILSLWLSMMQNPYSWRILSLSSLIFYRNAWEVKVRWCLQSWGACDWVQGYLFFLLRHLFPCLWLGFKILIHPSEVALVQVSDLGLLLWCHFLQQKSRCGTPSLNNALERTNVDVSPSSSPWRSSSWRRLWLCTRGPTSWRKTWQPLQRERRVSSACLQKNQKYYGSEQEKRNKS